MTPAQKTAALNALRDGYGSEDISVRLHIPVEEVRTWVGHMRRTGAFHAALGVNRHRNHDALRIMGVK